MAPAYPGAHQASCPPGGYTSSEWVSMQGHRGDRSSPAASATPAAADHLAAWRLAPPSRLVALTLHPCHPPSVRSLLPLRIPAAMHAAAAVRAGTLRLRSCPSWHCAAAPPTDQDAQGGRQAGQLGEWLCVEVVALPLTFISLHLLHIPTALCPQMPGFAALLLTRPAIYVPPALMCRQHSPTPLPARSPRRSCAASRARPCSPG